MPAIPEYKTIMDLIKKGMTVQAQEKTMELREAALETREENVRLKERVHELEERLSAEQSVEWEPPYYWVVKPDGRDGPFCQHCYDSERKLIRLQTEVKGSWQCHACGKRYHDSEYQAPPPIVVVPRSSPLDGLDAF